MAEQALTVYDLNPGKIISDRYEVVSANRHGGLSTAFKMKDLEQGDDCEMQLFPSALFESDEQMQEFAASWNPWKRVDSAAVLQVREILNLGDATMLLITDFPAGESLRTTLNDRGALPAEVVVSMGVQLLEGLSRVHSHGLIHGDIKPYTIHTVGEDSELAAQVVDGGITPGLWTAKGLGEKTALIGTPFYAPIEQFGGDSPNIQSDIYNVAAVLFEAVAGVLPWSGGSFLEVFQSKLDKSAPTLSKRGSQVEIDPDLEAAIVTGCLAERDKRYATAEDFAERLSGFLA